MHLTTPPWDAIDPGPETAGGNGPFYPVVDVLGAIKEMKMTTSFLPSAEMMVAPTTDEGWRLEKEGLAAARMAERMLLIEKRLLEIDR